MIRPAILFAVFVASFAVPVAFAQPAVQGKPSQTLSLLEIGPGLEEHIRPNTTQVTFSLSKTANSTALDVIAHPSKEDFPGINIHPTLTSWNLSTFGHVSAKVTNTGNKSILLALRVDNAGDSSQNPWNTESVTLEPGQSDTITTYFGYSYGHHKGFALKPQAIVNLMLFLVKSDQDQSFRVESVVAGGVPSEKPPAPPEEFRLKPASGVMFGPGVNLDLATQFIGTNVRALLVGTDQQPSLKLDFGANKPNQSALIRLPNGCWDLSGFYEVQVKVRNMGKSPVSPKARIVSRVGGSEWIPSLMPIPVGGSGTITIPFAGLTSAVIGQAGTGSNIASDAIADVEIQTDSGDTDRVLYIDAIQGVAPLPSPLPDWVGQRPPVPGDWIKTLDDEFDGVAIDSSIWSIYGENYYDKVSHWSKEDVIVGGGVVKLRYEKKLGFGNDDPKRPRSDYAAGYLQTYDKWAQRYGYFEARMKLPRSPGLWPAFWMMPDRGDRLTNQGVRQDTAKGGMEFDIMEHLTRWGPYRYNISMHYDGYGFEHKSVGSDKIYVQPDKDGFITCGLLWTPGSAVFYCNGQEVLRWDDPRVCSVPMSFLFTLPSGGWDNNELEDSQLPADFVIDYVRVWQRKDLVNPGDGKKPPLILSKAKG